MEATQKQSKVKEHIKKIHDEAAPLKKKLMRQAKRLKDNVLGAVGIRKDAASLFGQQLEGVKEHLATQLRQAGLDEKKIDGAVDLAISRMKSEKRDRASEVLGKTIEALQDAKKQVEQGKEPKLNVKDFTSEMHLDMNLSGEDINKLADAETPQEVQVAMHDIMDDKIHEAQMRGGEALSGPGAVDLSIRPSEPKLPIKDQKEILAAQKTAESLVQTLKQTDAYDRKIEDVKRKAVYASRQPEGMDPDVEEMRLHAVLVDHQDLLDMGIDEKDIYAAASNIRETAASMPRETNLYKALASHWKDETGGNVKGYMNDGATSTLTGFVSGFAPGLGVPDLKKLTDSLGPELASYAMASYLHDLAEKGTTTISNPKTGKREKFTLEHYDQMVHDITMWNRVNQHAAEERALQRLGEIEDAQKVLREQMASGDIAVNDELIERLKKAGLSTRNVQKIDTEGLRDRMAALQMDNRYLDEQEKLVGETIGGLQTAAGFLYSLKSVRRGREANEDLRDLSMHVGGEGLSEGEQEKLVREKLKSLGIKSREEVAVETGPEGATIRFRGERLVPHLERWVQDAQKASKLNAIKDDTSQINEKTNDWIDKPLSKGGLGTAQEILPQLKSGEKLRGNQATDIRWLMQSGGGVITRSTAAGKTLTGLGYLGARVDQDMKGPNAGYRGVVIVPPAKVSEWVQEAAKFFDPEKISIVHWKPVLDKNKEPTGKFVDPKLPKQGEGRAYIVEVPEHYSKGQIDSLLKQTKHLKHAIFVMNHQSAAENNEYLERQMGGSGRPPNGIVVDEPQMLLGLRGRNRMNIGKRIFSIPSTHKVALTATPARENLREAYDLVRWSAQRPAVDEKGAPIYKETVNPKTKEPTGRMRPVYEKEAGRQVGKKSAQPRPFIPYEMFKQLEGGSTSAQRDLLARDIMDQIGPYVSGDDVKKVSFKINHHDVHVRRSDIQRVSQKQIEAQQAAVYKKHQDKAQKGGILTTEDGRRIKYAKISADDPAGRREQMKRARQNAENEIANLHRLNVDAADPDDNPKIQSLVHNLKAEIQGGVRIRHEGKTEKREKISGKKRKHIVVVSSPQQAAAVQHALDQAGIANVSMATSLRDAKNPELLTKDIKDGGQLKGTVVDARKKMWKEDSDRIDDKTGKYVKGEYKIPVVIIDKDTAAGHNLQEADTLHVVGAPDDAATLLQAHGRAARDPKLGDQLDIYTYRHTDSPFEHAHWDNLHRQMDFIRATSPGMVTKPQMMPEKRKEVLHAIREAKEKAASAPQKPVRKSLGLFVTA